MKNNAIELKGEDLREGLTAVLSVKLPNPQFEGQTKTKLGNSEVAGTLELAMMEFFGTFLEENPPIAKKIVEKCVNSAIAREAARKARQLARRKTIMDGGGLPGQPSVTRYVRDGHEGGGAQKFQPLSRAKQQ